MHFSLITIKIGSTYTLGGNDAGTSVFSVDRFGKVFSNITTRSIRHITNKNKAVFPTFSKKEVAAGVNNIKSRLKDIRNIEKNAMIVRASVKRAKLTDKPMSNLMTVILTKTI